MFSFKVLFILIVATFVTKRNCVATNDPNNEAHSLALKASGELLVRQSLTRKLARELKSIRDTYPEVRHIVYAQKWQAGELLAQVSNEQIAQIRKRYGEVTYTPSFSDYKELKFTKKYNPEVLAKKLTSRELLKSAQPNYTGEYGEAENDIQYNVTTGIYTFSQRWGDCPSGCMYHHYWDFSVFRTSKAILLREYGLPLFADDYNW